MTPRTRSGGAAPPSSIVYKSTPALKQVQFPARRTRVRTYGKQVRKRGGGANNEDDDDKEYEEGNSSTHPTPARLKQKTLTQYDFASSFREESVVELSDTSDVENLDKVDETTDEAEKENNVPKGTKRRRSMSAKHAPLEPIDLTGQEGDEEEEEIRVPYTAAEGEEEEEEEDDEGPVVRPPRRARVGFVAAAGKTKRRRTLGEEHRMSTMKDDEEKKSRSAAARRRTLGDSPIAGPSRRRRYHTQTLTQFISRTASCVADSDADSEEELGGGSGKENEDFLEWLGDEEEGEEQDGPQSPTMGTQAGQRRGTQSPAKVWEDHSPSPRPSTRRRQAGKWLTQATAANQQFRDESVVPQTPIKCIRFGVPPSAQHVSPSPARLAAIYGAPNIYVSPSTQRQKSPVGKSSSSPLLELTGKPKKRAPIVNSPAKKPELVIADSCATEGWSSVGGSTQARHHGTTPSPPPPQQQRQQTQTQTQAEVFSTPAEESVVQPDAAASAAASTTQTSKSVEETAPPPLHTQSSQDGQVEEKFYGALSQIVQDSAVPTQQQQTQDSLPTTPPRRTTRSSQRPPPPMEKPAAAAGEEQEIPDSDEEEGDDLDADTDEDGTEDEDADDARFAAGAETQLLMDQLQSSARKWSGPPRAGNVPVAASSSSVASPTPPPRTSSPAPSPGSAVTPQSAPPSSSLKPATTAKPPLPRMQAPKNPGTVTNDIPVAEKDAPLLRMPLPLLHHDHPTDTQGLPLESQRVALATLQGFTPASARTDVLLPVSRATLDNLLAGRQDAVVLPFKVPAQVVRFWLLCDGVLRYLACLGVGVGAIHDPGQDNGRGGRGTWSYRAAQIYELNNPAREEDMREEEWVRGRVTRYVYFPPAVVSQLLWNLRQALFADEGEEEEQADDDGAEAVTTTPARVAAEIVLSSSSPLRHSARLSSSTPARSRAHRLPSSPLQHARRPPPSTMPAPPRPPRPKAATRKHHTQQAAAFVRPSQATTASQASTTAGAAAAGAPVTPRAAGEWSSESLVFDDHGGSSIPMPYSGVSGVEGLLEASQLLTGSQTLPDSLVRDEGDEEAKGEHVPVVPDEICDSEEEE